MRLSTQNRVVRNPRLRELYGRTSRHVLLIALGTTVFLGCSNSTSMEPVTKAEQAVVTPWTVLTDAEKQSQILDILERFVPFAESFWRASDITQSNTGRYAAVGSGVTQPRGAGDIAFAYVTLLEARPSQATFGGVSRETMIDHTIQSIRHEAYTNALSGAGYNWWGKGTWQASLETYSWAFAAHELWDKLDDPTKALVRTVVTGEANILITKAIASGEEGDTGAEDNGWNAPTPALAAIMFPDDSNAPAWRNAAMRLAINASSTSADATSTTLVDGKPLSDWMASVNLHPDLTMENHGYFNPIYQQVTHVDINDAAIAYAKAGQPLPEAFSFRTEAIWEAVLGRLATDEGDFAMTAGQDWVSKDFQHLEYLGILATRMQRPDASVFESRALQLVAQRQATHPNGSMLGQAQVGYETMLIKRLAALWWTHTYFGPSPAPTAEQFQAVRATASGVKQFPYSDFIAAQLGPAFVSMSWDSVRPLGLVIPSSDSNPSDPIFSYYEPYNSLGSVTGTVGTHSCDCRADRFSTAGFIGTREFSMTAFPDGVTMLLDRGQGSTFTYSLESITGLTADRPIWSDSGAMLGSLAGNWVNAADRLGMIVRGGAGINAAAATGTNNRTIITGSVGTGSGNRSAVLFPLIDHTRTAALDASVNQLVTPTEWSALSAQANEGTVRLAVARWGGAPSANLTISDVRGAPVPEEDAVLAGNSTQFTARLGAPASHGQIINFFVQGGNALHARQVADAAALIRNPSDSGQPINVTFVAGDGSTQTVSRTVAAGEEVRARLLDDKLTLAGPELEPLMEAREALTTLLDELTDEANPHQHRNHARPCRHLGHFADAALVHTTEVALGAIDRAIEESSSAAPDTERAARAVKVALSAVEALEREARMLHRQKELRDAVRIAAETAEQALEEALSQAYALSAWIEPTTLAQPGESLTLQVTLFNRGLRQARDGVAALVAPDGWTLAGPATVFAALEPGGTASTLVNVTVPANATPGEVVSLRTDVTYRQGHSIRTKSADTDVTIDPVLDLGANYTSIPLAAGGVNQAPFHLTNLTNHPMEVTLATEAPDGATATLSNTVCTLSAAGSLDVNVVLGGLSRTTGTGNFVLSATTQTGAVVKGSAQLFFSDDLALNALGAPWPKGTANSNQAAYPPSFAFDGNSSTFWVSGGTVAGQGPTPTQPQTLMVDFGLPSRIGSVTMVPRVNYGPKAYTIETSDDGTTWQIVATIASAPNTTVTTNLTPITTRYVRLQITGGWDRIQPPRNVQIVALNVRAAAP